MKNAILIIVGALCLMACSKDKPADDVGTSTTTRGATEPVTPVTVEEVRAVLLEKRPGSVEDINALVITNDNGIITLRGRVQDEATRSDLVNHVRAMPRVRGVKDEISAAPKGAHNAPDQLGTGAMGTGAMGTGNQAGRADEAANADKTATKSEAVRRSLAKAHPRSEAIIDALSISDNGDVVVLSGTVPDESTREAFIKAAKATPGVKGVNDQLKVQKK